MVHRLLAVGALSVGALVLGACADDDASRATIPDIAATGTDQLTFEPEAFEVPAGEEITLVLTAQAGVEHDVVIADVADVGKVGEESDMNMDMDNGEPGDLHVAHADAGQTTSVTFTIDEPGTYEVYCSVPGHREAGMTANLTAVDAA